jgi:microcystin-dependent protein
MGAYSYSGTAASNTTVDGIGAAGSDSPDNIDNLVRALAASDANLVRDLGGANTVAGTADAITVALADASTPTYFDGMRFSFRVGTDNATTTPTLNVDSLGAKTIKKAVAGGETAVVVGDLQAGMTAEVVYRSAWASAAGAFELLNPNSVLLGTNPIGTVVDYAGSSAPSGWLLCYGQTVSRTTYAALFAILSTTYGAGDGSTTFGIPDLRGRVIAGQDDMGGSSANRLTGASGGVDGDTLGASGGAETHVLTVAQLAAHTHSLPQTLNATNFVPSASSGVAGFSGSQNTGSAGSDAAHNNVQPTFILNKIIYAGV